MRIAPEIDGVTAVMVGDFNPPIYTPAWFALHGLLPEAVAESAELAVAHTEVTQFTADWLSLEVTRDRYQVRTLQAPHIRVHDLILRVFGEHMQHTPLRAFGILLIHDTPPVGMYVLNMFRMRGSRLWGSRLHRACVV